MAKSNEKKCCYSHCKHESKIINLSQDEYEVENNRYFHTDCKHEKDTMLEIIDYWYKNIDKDVIFTQLRRIIDRLVYVEKMDADYILYALKRKAKYLNHPPGLVYAVKDKVVKKDYEYEQKLKAFNESKKKPIVQQSDEPTFTYNENEGKKKFGDIFGGK